MARLARNAPRCRPRRSRSAGPITRNKSYTPHCSRWLLITRVNQRGLRVYRGSVAPPPPLRRIFACAIRILLEFPRIVIGIDGASKPYLIQTTCNLRRNEVTGAVECLAMAPFSCKLIPRRSAPIGFHFNGISSAAVGSIQTHF